jgi:hypothetical protein
MIAPASTQDWLQAFAMAALAVSVGVALSRALPQEEPERAEPVP